MCTKRHKVARVSKGSLHGCTRQRLAALRGCLIAEGFITCGGHESPEVPTNRLELPLIVVLSTLALLKLSLIIG